MLGIANCKAAFSPVCSNHCHLVESTHCVDTYPLPTLAPDPHLTLGPLLVLPQVAKGIRDPSSGLMGHSTFEQVLQQWRDNKQSLPQQMRNNVATECATNLLGDQSQTGLKALQHKYRVAAHAVLAADSNLADQVTRV